MPVYSDSEQLNEVAQRLFQRLQAEKPAVAGQLVGSRLLIRLKCRDPLTEMWLDGRRYPLQTSFGYQRLHPDLEISLTGDTLHAILLDQLSLVEALSSGRLQAEGKLWKARALSDLFHEGQGIYRQILQEMGKEL